MNLSPYELSDLIARHIQQKLSADESVRLLEWLNASDKNQRLFDRMVKAEQVKESFDFFDTLDTDAAWKKVERKRNLSRIKTLTPYLAYAAAIACVIFTITVFLPKPLPPQELVEVVAAKNVQTKGETTTLELSNGDVVNLSNDYLKITEQKGFHIVCNAGELNYSASNVNDQLQLYNTLVVPKSGTYKLVLADGTKVWLNTLSEIQFPVQFNQAQRTVKLKGEAYFEVAHDPSKPFFVEVNHQKIEVLGTHFNVNSYDGLVKTTLVEGSVKVSNAFGFKFMVPGEEADASGNTIRVKKGDLKKALAWRDNEFYFRNESMRDILKEISRWYDFKINDDQLMDDKRFSGIIERDLELAAVFKILQSLSGYRFHYDGVTVSIEPQKPENKLETHK